MSKIFKFFLKKIDPLAILIKYKTWKVDQTHSYECWCKRNKVYGLAIRDKLMI